MVVEVRNDSNADGQSGTDDALRVGVVVTIQFAGTTFVGTTDSNGLFRTGWIRDLYANVVDMVLSGYSWDPLDLHDEDDADGKPVSLLSI